MTDDLPFLAPGPLPLGAASGVEIVAPIGRVGDGLVYAGRAAGAPVRIREYAPAGIVRRLPDGSLHPAHARYAGAWEAALQAFLDNGERLAALDHDGIAAIARSVPAAADGVLQGGYWIGAPTGAPLAAAAGEVLRPGNVLRYAAGLADALAALHGKSLLHLDIAPQTASAASGRLALTDPAVDNRAFIALLGSQQGLVRPHYAAIEQADATAAEPLTPATDVHGAACLLYRLVEGRDPPTWQERFRDPAAAPLADRAAYPPAFLVAIRRGMAVEPGDRFADGAAFQAALALPPAAPPIAAAPRPIPAAAPPVSTPVAHRSWIVPLLVAILILVIAALGYLAYQQRWFVPERDAPPAGNMIAAPVPIPTPRPAPPVDAAPAVAIGDSVAGRLTASDRRRGAGQYEDRFTLNARGGERVEISVSSAEFDPVVEITGPGLNASNDDGDEDDRDSRLAVTLPRAGRYTIAVTSYDRDETGGYLLQVSPGAAPVDDDGVSTLDLSAATRLSGRWHGEGDDLCAKPATNTVVGNRLTSRIGDDVHVHSILAAEGNVVRTLATSGPQAGGTFTFRLADDGLSYRISGETWLRC